MDDYLSKGLGFAQSPEMETIFLGQDSHDKLIHSAFINHRPYR